MLIESWYDFLLGVFSTLIFGLIVNFLVKTYQRYTKDIEAARKPQTVIQKTEKTPKEIVDAADTARVKRILLLTIIAIIWLAMLYTIFPDIFAKLVTVIGL